ncbi:CRISP/Allergen/PR-1 [Araneus ventricosus]|uniref:CRISP/Allergen/PR-1 n=1 Tax=Araneus ventricosus TaxID=182803 RepID=A0A4Y2MGD7_ARAVE|nr:CRISP/Allergen/PR-1 [Araneus ventricosus]
MCQGYGCREDMQTEPNWQKAIKGLYEEVLDYQKDWLWSFEEHPGPMTGHFTQLIWSRSWRIGCGYTSFKEGSLYKKFYVCNYGPGGNTEKQPVYKKGDPCTACPVNSCCGSSCRGGLSYPGLCKIFDPNTSPEYRRPSNLFFCGASLNDRDCQAVVNGADNWRNIKSVGGNYDSIVLNGGESTTVSFNKAIVPNTNSFCLVVKFRKGPLDASRRDKSSFKADFKMEGSFASPMSLQSHSTSFKDYRISLQWGSRTKLAFTFSVPRGAGFRNCWTQEGIPTYIPAPRNYIKSLLQKESILRWQKEWGNGETGRSVHNVLPKVKTTPTPWQRPEIMFVTGLGPFSTYFKRFNIRSSDSCGCGNLGNA